MKFIDFPAPKGQTVTINPEQVCQIFRDPRLMDAAALLDFGSGEPQGVSLSVADAGKRLGIPLARLDGVDIGMVLVAPAQVTFVREAEPGRPETGSRIHFGNARHRAVKQSRAEAVRLIMTSAKDAGA